MSSFCSLPLCILHFQFDVFPAIDYAVKTFWKETGKQYKKLEFVEFDEQNVKWRYCYERLEDNGGRLVMVMKYTSPYQVEMVYENSSVVQISRTLRDPDTLLLCQNGSMAGFQRNLAGFFDRFVTYLIQTFVC